MRMTSEITNPNDTKKIAKKTIDTKKILDISYPSDKYGITRLKKSIPQNMIEPIINSTSGANFTKIGLLADLLFKVNL